MGLEAGFPVFGIKVRELFRSPIISGGLQPHHKLKSIRMGSEADFPVFRMKVRELFWSPIISGGLQPIQYRMGQADLMNFSKFDGFM